MIDSILLAPYRVALRLRHFAYNRGFRKVYSTRVPSICVGNITAGGTGKTPFTEMLVRLLLSNSEWEERRLAVLSRGYKRKSKGFLLVTEDGNVKQFGDEPLQIKRKFTDVVVAVDKDRINGCRRLCTVVPYNSKAQKKAAKEAAEERGRGTDGLRADIVILDDAFQYRALKPTVSIVLVDYNRPTFRDHLIPLGRLRDLPERIAAADIVVVTKCPSYISEEKENKFTEKLGYKGNLFYTTTGYDGFAPVFLEGDMRYTHSPRLILFTGIADDRPLVKYLSLNFKIVKHITFEDHHWFTPGDISNLRRVSEEFPNAVIMTTEKDAQRISGCEDVPAPIKERLFYVPIRTTFLSTEDANKFASTLFSYINSPSPEQGE